MKKIVLTLTIITTLFVFTLSCNKSTTASHNYANAILWNKSIDSIKYFINGKWQLVYFQGGYSPIKKYVDNTYWTFKDTNRIIQQEQNNIVIDTTFLWNWGFAYRTGGDSSNLIKFAYDNTGVNFYYVAYKIVDDTLVLEQNSIDGAFYYLIKKQ